MRERNRAMRRLASALRVLMLLALASAPLVAQSRAELSRFIRQRVLPNGLEVIVVENHGVPLATIEIDVKNGSFTQTPDYAGLAHMYEHMFFKASASFPDPGAFLARAGEIGAEFNGTTTEERVNYYMTVLADSLESGMKLLAASLRDPLFRDDELAREKEVVLGEYDRNESNPFFQLTQAMGPREWGGLWSRKNTIGDRAVIRSVTPQKMREIQRRYYVPNNSALIVTGDVDPAVVFALAERIYGSWERGADPFANDPVPAMPALAKDDAIIVEQQVSAITVVLEWHGPSVGGDAAATYAADVLSDALNQAGSAMQKRLVDSGLWDGVSVNYYTLNHVGPISISGQTSRERFKKAMTALKAEIEQFADPKSIASDVLEEVKAERAIGSAFGFERASGLSHTVGFWWAVASLDYFMGYVDNMAKQTSGDLRTYVQKYIVGKPRVIGVLMSPDDRRALGLTEAELVALAGRGPIP